MILSGKEIKKRIGKDILIDPFDEKQLNPNSYNLRLSNELYCYSNSVLDMSKENILKKEVIKNTGIRLMPNKLYLGRTKEYTKTENLVPAIEGRSSIGRLGLFIHITAGFGDVGFCGYWTLEISCIQPIIIYPDIEICQIFYHEIKGDFDNYKGKYQNNNGVQASMIIKEIDNNRK